MNRYGMVVDLNRCVGCQTCTIACKHANDTLPGVQWRKVLDVETGTYPDVQRLFMVVGCQHCAEPPCVPVCPTGATFQRDDGLVAMEYDKCIGCGYCAVSCPYQARTIAHEHGWYFGEQTRQEVAVNHPERLGVAQKCTFCVERIDDAKQTGLVPGVDPAATPACASSCIAQAIQFGDFNDGLSHVSQLLKHRSSFQMHEELGTDPQIRYLYETPSVPGENGGLDEAEQADPHNPLVGSPQPFWDMRAAANFILGGFGSGLALISWLLWLIGGVNPEPLIVGLFLVGGVLMASGLLAVFLEIGRKERFYLALLRPQSSWMTREIYAVVLFYGALGLDWMMPHPVLHTLVGLSAAGFLFCQARILHAARGIPTWRHPLIPWMVIATGLLEGTALVGLVLSMPRVSLGDPTQIVAATGLVLVGVNAGLWWLYRANARNAGIAPLADNLLRAITPWLHGTGSPLTGGRLDARLVGCKQWRLSHPGGTPRAHRRRFVENNGDHGSLPSAGICLTQTPATWLWQARSARPYCRLKKIKR